MVYHFICTKCVTVSGFEGFVLQVYILSQWVGNLGEDCSVSELRR